MLYTKFLTPPYTKTKQRETETCSFPVFPCLSAQAAGTNDHTLGGADNTDLFLIVLETSELEIKVLIFSQGPVPGLSSWFVPSHVGERRQALWGLL